MSKEKEDTNYHMGKHTGYSLIDGVYHIAPIYTKQLEDLAMQKIGVDEMLGSVTRHAAKTFELLLRMNRKLWEDMVDDLGLDPTIVWKFQNGTVWKSEINDK